MVINAALNFDSYIIMRYGAQSVDDKESNGSSTVEPIKIAYYIYV